MFFSKKYAVKKMLGFIDSCYPYKPDQAKVQKRKFLMFIQELGIASADDSLVKLSKEKLRGL